MLSQGKLRPATKIQSVGKHQFASNLSGSSAARFELTNAAAPTSSDERRECKAVADENVTYQFLICHDTLVWRDAEAGSRNSGGSYGSSAFSILSDGKQASSAVKLTFGESLQIEHKSEYAHSSDQFVVW
jgi:hypothetical protein